MLPTPELYHTAGQTWNTSSYFNFLSFYNIFTDILVFFNDSPNRRNSKSMLNIISKLGKQIHVSFLFFLLDFVSFCISFSYFYGILHSTFSFNTYVWTSRTPRCIERIFLKKKNVVYVLVNCRKISGLEPSELNLSVSLICWAPRYRTCSQSGNHFLSAEETEWYL